MALRDIVVIGASAGGVEVLKKLVKGLPPDFSASVFVVWHTAPGVTGFLPRVLQRGTDLKVTEAVDREPIEAGHIYIARPNYHLLVERGVVRVTRGPKENRFRPAVDPLFRAAAYAYGSRVVGIILTGALDDGTAGLWTIKNRGGTAVVQDPDEAEVPSMPESAIRGVEVDYVVPSAVMPDLLMRLTAEEVVEAVEVSMEEDRKNSLEVRIAAEDNAFEKGVMELGELSSLTCPDCHGVFLKLRDGKIVRFRCHTGHAYSPDSLLETITEQIEKSLWSTVRALEENVMLLNYIGEQYAGLNQKKLADAYLQKAKEAEERIKYIRDAAMRQEQLNSDIIRRQAAD